MQEISIYLYPNNLDAFTNLDTWDGMRYRRVYNRNLKLYGGVDNKIKIQVRNVDQKPVNLTGSTMVFTLVSRDSQELLLEKDCSVYDITTGALTVSISKSELLDIEPGLYNYSIRRETRTAIDNDEYIVNASYPLYVDSQYDAIGTIEVLGNISGNATTSKVTKEWIKKLVYDKVTIDDDYFISGIVDAQPQFGTPQTLHSFQVYMTNYTGDFEIQGSLSEGGNPGTWVVLSSQSYTNKSMDFLNIVGKWNFFRFKYSPDSGTVDKVLYR
jgi:hypothetical protein